MGRTNSCECAESLTTSKSKAKPIRANLRAFSQAAVAFP